jgi:hypothetical protein
MSEQSMKKESVRLTESASSLPPVDEELSRKPHMDNNQKKGLKMPVNFGHIEPEHLHKQTVKKELGYCELPHPSEIDFESYNENHLRNMLVGLNSDKPEIVSVTKQLLNYYLEFRQTKPDDYVPSTSKYTIPTVPEIMTMMRQKVKIPKINTDLETMRKNAQAGPNATHQMPGLFPFPNAGSPLK